jgi:broad specificity phosphatase PhoE
MSNAVELNLYRHGHVPENDNPGIVTGQNLSAELDTLGESQAQGLGEFMRGYGIRPDIAYSSHARRVVQTGSIALSVMDPFDHLPLIVEPNLVEQDMGFSEGRPREEVYTPAVKAKIAQLGAEYRHPGGESMADVGRRMFAFLLNSARNAEAEELAQVSAFSHNVSIATVVAKVEGVVAPDEMRDRVLSLLGGRVIGNASRTLIVYEKGQFRLEHIGEPTS